MVRKRISTRRLLVGMRVGTTFSEGDWPTAVNIKMYMLFSPCHWPSKTFILQRDLPSCSKIIYKDGHGGIKKERNKQSHCQWIADCFMINPYNWVWGCYQGQRERHPVHALLYKNRSRYRKHTKRLSYKSIWMVWSHFVTQKGYAYTALIRVYASIFHHSVCLCIYMCEGG